MMDSRGVGVVEGCTVYTVEDVKIQYVSIQYVAYSNWLRLKILTLVIAREPLYPEGIAPELNRRGIHNRVTPSAMAAA